MSGVFPVGFKPSSQLRVLFASGPPSVFDFHDYFRGLACGGLVAPASLVQPAAFLGPQMPTPPHGAGVGITNTGHHAHPSRISVGQDVWAHPTGLSVTERPPAPLLRRLLPSPALHEVVGAAPLFFVRILLLFLPFCPINTLGLGSLEMFSPFALACPGVFDFRPRYKHPKHESIICQLIIYHQKNVSTEHHT